MGKSNIRRNTKRTFKSYKFTRIVRNNHQYQYTQSIIIIHLLLFRYLYKNQLCGNIPSELGNIKNLQRLFVIIININIINQYLSYIYYSGHSHQIKYQEIFQKNLKILKT